ncbi:hypothetical protein K9M48_02260 [Candidatus Gracilibacteria bacterium]|nr:hypothetical protein [Candidatus Gracilibacteria bacterium]
MKLLFVCTGNVFRSMSAEYLAKKHIKDNKIKGIEVSSAGTTARPQNPFSYTLKRLDKYGCNASKHRQTKVSNEVLKDKDFVICMAKHHQEVIKSLGYESVLFNFIAYGKNKDVMDEAEYEQKYGSYGDLENYCNNLVDYLHDAMPKLIEGLDKFEIERKFMIKELPKNISKYPKNKIIQGYFKDIKNKTVRIRKTTMKSKTEYFQTIKKGHGLIRKEIEKEINKESFDKLRKKVGKRHLEKTRYIIAYKAKKIELDVYEGKLKGLVTAEIEFKTLLESKKFIIPKRFDKELTKNRKFTNSNLAKKSD